MIKRKINLVHIKSFFKKFESQIWLFTSLCLLLIIIFQFAPISKKSIKGTFKSAPEILEIKSTQKRSDQEKIYKSLIERVGPDDAQEELLRSGLPFTGETHLLNHIVGDYLYENFGVKGLVQCKDYFLSSCYHGFILHAISDGGMTAVGETFAECLKYGHSVYTQCAHGIGHGFLANGGYKNLLTALETCDEAERIMEGFPIFNCYDGVFMENIWAIHDGKPSPDRWVKEEDPFYPCNDPRIDPKYLRGCWSNQPALAYQLFKGDIQKVATEVCSKISNIENKQMCFDGLSRQIHPITKGKVEKTVQLCSLLQDERWTNYCMAVNAGASYAVGDRKSPFEVCAATAESGKRECYTRVFGTMHAYKKAGEDSNSLCQQIKEEEWKENCRNF